MDKNKIILTLKLAILILAITFLIIFNTNPKYHCEACSFGERELPIQDFFNIYSSECIKKPSEFSGLNLSDFNDLVIK